MILPVGRNQLKKFFGRTSFGLLEFIEFVQLFHTFIKYLNLNLGALMSLILPHCNFGFEVIEWMLVMQLASLTDKYSFLEKIP